MNRTVILLNDQELAAKLRERLERHSGGVADSAQEIQFLCLPRNTAQANEMIASVFSNGGADAILCAFALAGASFFQIERIAIADGEDDANSTDRGDSAYFGTANPRAFVLALGDKSIPAFVSSAPGQDSGNATFYEVLRLAGALESKAKCVLLQFPISTTEACSRLSAMLLTELLPSRIVLPSACTSLVVDAIETVLETLSLPNSISDLRLI